MNLLQQFIASKPCGFITDADLPAIIELDRLCPLLVRCGGCRFTAAAQYIAHMIKAIEAAGDYVRDVSFPVGSMERAQDWKPAGEGLVSYCHADYMKNASRDQELNRLPGVPFDPSQCGGTFDGFTVGSDADPGL